MSATVWSLRRPRAPAEAEHAALQRTLEVQDVVREVCRLVESEGAIVAFGEDAVDDHGVKVEVRVEGGAKRCRKEMAPSCASPGAGGLARRSVVRMARSRMRSTSPARRGS
jgi:hypothetical protein